MNLAPDYEEIERALRAAGLDISAAEMHGTVTAAASFAQPPALAEMLFAEHGTPGTPEADRVLALGENLEQEVRTRFEDTEFEFEPMLGEASITERVERLAAWSRGYLLGLAAGGLQDPTQLAGDAGEFLVDAIRIGEVEMDEDEDAERQEHDLAEIIEYLRVGVQLVYEELRRE
jgi:uncharacterized protein